MTTPRRANIRLVIASAAALLSVIALGYTIVYRITTTNELRKQTAVNCRQIENLKSAITGVLADSKTTSLNRTSDPAIRKAIERYYNRQFARFSPDPCPNP
jgi:hypothetical protein